MFRKIFLASAVLAVAVTGTAKARDQIRAAGSSTVFPFTTAVAEEFGRTTKFKTPIVESTGTGGGFKLFCSGIGVDKTDISNASRRIKSSEVSACEKNGVKNIVEFKIGFDGIVIANSKKAKRVEMTLEQLWRALAKEVPMNGKWVPNPYKNWNEIDPKLPAVKIEVLGPPPTSGTRDSFNELALEGGCKNVPEVKALKDKDEKRYKDVCQSIREDGAYIEAGENDNVIVQKIEANPDAFGVFGFSFLDQNADKLQGSIVNGVEPTVENISDGKYPVSRSMFVYVKGEHVGVIPGLREFMAEYTSEKAFGPRGYLADKGLIPLPDADRAAVRKNVDLLKPVTTGSL